MCAQTAEELVVKMTSDGVSETTEELEAQGEQFEETAETAGEQAGVLEDFSAKWEGAMGAIVGGLAVAAGGLLSQVPVIGQVFQGLVSVIEGIAFQMDKVLRPVLQPVADGFFTLSNALFGMEGPAGAVVGILGTLASIVATVLGVLTVIQGPVAAVSTVFGTLASVAGTVATGLGTIASVLAGLVSLPALVAAGVVALVAAFATDFMGIRTKVIDALKDLTGWFGDLAGAVGDLAGEGVGMVADFASGIASAATDAVDAASDVVDDITGEFIGVVLGATQWGKSIVLNLLQGIKDLAISAVGGAKDLISDISDEFSDLIDDALEWGKDLIREFVAGVVGMKDWAADKVGGVFDAITPDLQFDIRANDQMAQRWGEDMIQHFTLGAQQQAQRASVPLPTDAGDSAGPTPAPRTRRGESQQPVIMLDGRRLNEGIRRHRDDSTALRGRYD